MPLGALSLQEASQANLKEARRIADSALEAIEWLKPALRARTFFAVGGTWRAIARLHMEAVGYPLHVLQHYRMDTEEALKFARRLQERPIDTFPGAADLSTSRRETVPYGAAVLERLLKIARPACVRISAQGVREGLLFGLMDPALRRTDPLLSTCADLADHRARSGAYARELAGWSDHLFAQICRDETPVQRRDRHAACLISDIGWRVHPAYRGEQSINIMENGAFSGVDHYGRAFISLAVYYRHEGLVNDAQVDRLKQLVVGDMRARARILGAMLRLAHVLTAGEPGLIGGAAFEIDDDMLVLRLEERLRDFTGERLERRLVSIAREIGREARITVGAQ